MSYNNKLPASTTAVGSYLNAVRDEMDPETRAVSDYWNTPKSDRESAAELSKNVSAASRKAIDRVSTNFWDDVASGNDAAIKSILNNVDPVVAKEVRNAMRRISEGNEALAASTRKKGLLAKQTTEAQRAQTSAELKGLKQPADPATTLARLIRRSMASKQQTQAQLPGETPEAKITPATQRT